MNTELIESYCYKYYTKSICDKVNELISPYLNKSGNITMKQYHIVVYNIIDVMSEMVFITDLSIDNIRFLNQLDCSVSVEVKNKYLIKDNKGESYEKRIIKEIETYINSDSDNI